QRALAALKSFRSLIEDGRAMLAGTYVERLEQTARAQEDAVTLDESPEDADVSFDPSEDENISFDFGDAGLATGTLNPPEAGEGARSTPTDDAFRAPGGP